MNDAGKRTYLLVMAALFAAGAGWYLLFHARGLETTEPVKAPEPVRLKFFMWGNRQQAEMYERLFARFTGLYPDVVVDLESVPYPEYQQKLSVLAAGRELPDIAWAADRMIPQFMANDILTDISEATQGDDFRLDDFIPSTLNLFRDGAGRLHGLPFSTPPSVMFYNKDLFAQAGLPLPETLYGEGRWTWEEFRKAARAIAAAGKGKGDERVYGANFFRDWKTWIQLSSYAWSYGSGPFDERMTKFTWDDGFGVETMSMLQDMMFAEQSHPKVGVQAGFESGKVGMFFDVYSYVAVARTIRHFEWNIAPLPSGSEGPVPMLGQAGYVIFKGSKQPEAAKRLLRFLASREGIEATSALFVPPRMSVLNSESFLRQPGNPALPNIKLAVIDQMPSARFQPGHVRWQAVDTQILLGLDRLFGKELSPEETVRWMKERVDSLLAED